MSAKLQSGKVFVLEVGKSSFERGVEVTLVKQVVMHTLNHNKPVQELHHARAPPKHVILSSCQREQVAEMLDKPNGTSRCSMSLDTIVLVAEFRDATIISILAAIVCM